MFRGKGKHTQASNVRSAVEFILLGPGQQVGRVRRRIAELLVGYMGGDMHLDDWLAGLLTGWLAVWLAGCLVGDTKMRTVPPETNLEW